MSKSNVDARSGDAARDQFRRLTVLIAVACIDMIGFAMVFPLLPFYVLKLHASAQMIGLIISSYAVAQLISAPLWGRVSDRFGRRPALLIGLSASAIAFLVFGFADSVWLFFLSRIVQGAGGGTTGVTQAYIADTVRPEDRARSLGWLSAGTNFGTMLGPVIGSFMTHWGQQAPGILAASLCVANVIFAWKWLPESIRGANMSPIGRNHKEMQILAGLPPKRKPVWNSIWSVIQHPKDAVPLLTLIYASAMFANSAMTSILALYLGAEFGVTERTIGFVFLYIGLFSLAMRSVMIGPIVARIGETWSMRAGTVSLILGLIGYPLAHNLWTLALAIPLVPIGTALLFPATTALISRATPRADLGTTLGVAQTFAGISRVFAPVISTALFQHASHGTPFLLSAVVVGFVSLLSFQIESQPTVQPVHVVD